MRSMAEKSKEDCPCHFYLAEWPQEGEVVMTRLVSIESSQSYVTLLEYGDKEALLPHTESTSESASCCVFGSPGLTRTKNIMSKGVLLYLISGYIDVSKRRVDLEEREACRQRYLRGKVVQGVVRRVGELVGMTTPRQLLELNHKTAWWLDTLHNKPTASYDVFQEAYVISNAAALNDLHLDLQTLTFLLENIKHWFCPRNITVRADVEVMCWSSEGVDAIKEALKAATNSTLPGGPPVQVTVVSPPVYTLTCVTKSTEQATAMLTVQEAMKCIKNTISNYSGGKFHVLNEPSSSTQLDAEFNDKP